MHRAGPTLALAALFVAHGCPRQRDGGSADATPPLTAPVPVAPPVAPLPGGPGVPPAVPPPGVANPGVPPGPTGTGAAVAPRPPTGNPADVALRAALNGTWELRQTQPTPGGGTVTSRCELVVQPLGARETCTTTTALGPRESHPCRATREPRVRVTAAPYSPAVTNGELLFVPGASSVVSDNGCAPAVAEPYTLMGGRWDGTSRAMTLTYDTRSGESSVAYQRVR